MKNTIICGCPLSGKSTLANILSQQFGLSHIPIDPIITSFEKNFPKLGIGHSFVSSIESRRMVSKTFYPFLKDMITEFEEENIKSPYVIEGFHIDIESIVKDFKDSHEIIIVAYPSIGIDEKYNITRQHDQNNRTTKVNENELKQLIGLFIDLSKYYKEICDKYSIKIVDTHNNQKEVIDKLLEQYK